ncbi:MAG: redoxin domain-containing protein [Burkholderiales bacterium]|nr:redoxin domain-containing protein [Burkholderiales bacterium]
MLLSTPKVETGWQAQPFTLCDPDGKSHALKDLYGKNGLLIAFICNHCPYVKAVVDRFVSDSRVLQSEGINVVAIMPNDYQRVPDDSPDNMKRFATQHGFTFPYLIDEDQSVARAYEAVCTPDFFGFDHKGKLQYRGRLDDARMGDSAHRSAELLEAMRLIATTGKGPDEQHASMGCSIKWRER